MIITISETVTDCNCCHHVNNKKPTVPWLPKKTTFAVNDNDQMVTQRPNATKTNRPVPNLAPIPSASQNISHCKNGKEPPKQKTIKTKPSPKPCKTNLPIPNLAPLPSTNGNVAHRMNDTEPPQQQLVQTEPNSGESAKVSESQQTPNLVSNRSSAGDTAQATLSSEMMDAQIRINAQIMEEVNALRAEKIKLLANAEKKAKESDFFKTKFAHATEQLSYLKKKIDKNGKVVENRDPRLIKLKAAFEAKPLRERDMNSCDLSKKSNGKKAEENVDMTLDDENREPNPDVTGVNNGNVGVIYQPDSASTGELDDGVRDPNANGTGLGDGTDPANNEANA